MKNKSVRQETTRQLIRQSNKQVFKINARVCKLYGMRACKESFEKLGLTVPRNMRGELE